MVTVMDDDTRRMLAEAYALDDEVKREHERWQRDYQRRLQQLKQRSAPDELVVYKTHYPPARQQHSTTTTMDPATSDAWNRWMSDYVRAHVEHRLKKYSEDLVDAVGEAMSTYVHERLSAETTKLREEFNRELGSLRADMTIDRAIKRGEVSQLHGEVPKKRRSDVA
jgi:hypothetical protein